MDYNDLLANVKGHLRPLIERKMQQPTTKTLRDFLGVRERLTPEDRQAFIAGTACLLPNAIDRCITNIMAIGDNATLDAAARAIYEMHSALGGSSQPEELAIESLTHELQLCSRAFSSEIAIFARMHKLSQSGLLNEEVWSQIRDSRNA
jgi:hypothetical protein